MRLLVHVEGQTEEVFVNEVLSSYLADHGYSAVSARLLGNARLRVNRGGIRSWVSVRTEIANHLKGDGGAIATTFVDYYALPGGDRGWPGRDGSTLVGVPDKARVVERAIHEDFALEFGPELARRFVPYIAMHEFEGLLFSDCDALAKGLGDVGLVDALTDIRNAFDSPEHINDSPLTAPSKRIIQVAPGYQKTFNGPLAAMFIGLNRIRQECPGFDDWITRLLAVASGGQ